MARINGILRIMVQQDGTELRLGTDRVPKLYRNGLPLRFLMPETDEDTFRHLLGAMLDTHEAQLEAEERVNLTHDDKTLGHFEVTLALRFETNADGELLDPKGPPIGVDAIFRRQATGKAEEEEDDFPTPDWVKPDKSDAVPAESVSLNAVGPQAVSVPARMPAPTRVVPPPSLASLLTYAMDFRPSDIHLAANEAPILRVDGRLRPMEATPVAPSMLEDLMTPFMRAQLNAGASADFAMTIPTVGRFRANLYRSESGLSLAIRALHKAAPTLEQLNLPTTLTELVDMPHGLVLVCGPTGSGKSSTLAALAQHILNKRASVLISLEEPIEYLLSPANRASIVRQREIGRHVRDFSTGLRDALREDPDVILVGEMRDPETISLALTAAETGHLVLSSLHSRTAISTIERIVDAYPAERAQQIRTQLADALKVVVSQKLLPRSVGRGRLPALEIAKVNHSIAAMIREGRTAQIMSAIQSGGQDGMVPLDKALAELVLQERVDERVAMAASHDRETFKRYLVRRF